MQTKTINTIEVPGNAMVTQKVLTLNGYSAIQCCSLTENQAGSIFLGENTLLFVMDGAITVRHGKMQYEVKKDKFVFLKRDILIEYETPGNDSSARVEYMLFSIKHELITEFTRLAELSIPTQNDEIPSCINMDKRLVKYIDSLEPYFIEPEKVRGSLVKIKLLELLFYLAGMDNNILGQLLDMREQFRNNITATVEENIMNSLSLYQLAVMSGRSLSSFRRDFLAIYNMPPSQWIRRKRLEKAQELLLRTTMTITDICYTLGFESIAHFSRLFKSQFGNSPSGFRLNVFAD